MRRLLPALTILLALAGTMAGTMASAGPIRRDPAIEASIGRLLARMTLQEKIGQLNLPSHVFPRDGQLEEVRQGRIGGVLNVAHPDHIREFAAAARGSRLGIPLLFGLDAIYAFRIAFPPPLAWAATWRPSLAEAAAEAIAGEAAAIGINWTFAPMVDVSRDPRWGRVIEGAGEDAVLGAAFAAARVRGYRKGGLATSVKHFVGYGAPEGGREYNGAEISTAELYDRYLPPFRAAIEAGSETVMASFNTINGVPVTANRALITNLLKRDLGFDGAVTSDFVAVGELVNHGVAVDLSEAARKAFLAGVDLDMESRAYDIHLGSELAAGHVSRAAIDDAVRRVLRIKFRLGLFDKTPANFAALPLAVSEVGVRATAREVARESFVLLKNEHAALPIVPGYLSVALIGAAAQSTNDHSWYGPAGQTKPETETLLEALRKRIGPRQSLDYVSGFADPCGKAFADKDAAIAASLEADLTVLIVSEDCDASGEGVSRTDLALTGVQQELLEALAATGRRIVLVVETGRPLVLTAAAKLVGAVLIAWHPGTEGRTALAEALVGEVNPSGKLPMTFPRAIGQIPLAYNGLPTSRPWNGQRFTTGYIDEDPTPLYPFGHGLSYTEFGYSDLQLVSNRVSRNGTLEASVTVTNTGRRDGSEVVQLYTRQLVASRSRPVRELKAFQKINLQPGEARTVRFRLPARDLGFHDDAGRLIIEPGPFKLFAGGSSAADLWVPFTLVAD